jgi:hypothetical protein
MNVPIERVDNKANAQPGEIVKRVERSEKEKNRQGFSRALEEKLKEELEKEKNQQSDKVLITGDPENKDKQPQDNHRRQPPRKQTADGDADDESESDSFDGHLDIKA